jgi:DNA-binding transcriptional ArsR family regulator
VDGGLDARRLGALAHPIRVRILEETESEAVSPSEIAVAIGEPLGVVAYHFRVLHNVGLIELAATERRRGSIQSFYRATGSGWSELATTLRGMVGESSDDP